MLDRIFRLSENQTTARREVLAGLTTFLTMAYIVFVNPAILSSPFDGVETGLDHGAVMLATCVAAAVATAVMGLWARYPVALAPGMGTNVFFVSVIVTLSRAGVEEAWRAALGVVFVAGVVFLLLSLLRVREAIIAAISPSLRAGIAVGIGVFIAFVGFKNAGLVVAHPVSFVDLTPDLAKPGIAVFAVGLLVTAALHTRRIPGAVLGGIIAATLAAVGLGEVQFPTFAFGLPDIERPAAFRMDIAAAFQAVCIPFIIVFVFVDLFDTLGTLVGVSERAGFLKDGRLPRAQRAFLADAGGTVVGACLGTSTVTSYIESAAGIEQGGRTGLTAVTVSVCFLAALFFSPVVAMVGAYPPITASALIVVGAMMMQNVTGIDSHDTSEALPAFLVIIGIPLTFSIADGLAIGFVVYPVLKVLSGKARDVNPLMAVLAATMLCYLLFVV